MRRLMEAAAIISLFVTLPSSEASLPTFRSALQDAVCHCDVSQIGTLLRKDPFLYFEINSAELPGLIGSCVSTCTPSERDRLRDFFRLRCDPTVSDPKLCNDSHLEDISSEPTLGGTLTAAPRTAIYSTGELKYLLDDYLCIHFPNEDAIRSLRDLYSNVDVPDFLLRTIDQKVFPATPMQTYAETLQSLGGLLDIAPDEQNGKVRFTINPQYMKPKEGKELASLRDLRDAFSFSFLGYYLPSSLRIEIQNRKRISSGDMPPRVKFGSLERPGSPLRRSLLDLTGADLPWLERLSEEGTWAARFMIDYMIYGGHLKPHLERVNLYFHFPYPPATAGLHLHARVNQLMVGAELGRSFGLNEIIRGLSGGKTIERLVLERQHQLGGCFYLLKKGTGEWLEEVKTQYELPFRVKKSGNPFKDFAI